MTTKTLFGGDHGTLVLWPDTHRQMSLPLADFKTANELGMAINSVTNEAFQAGRRSMQAEVARLVA